MARWLGFWSLVMLCIPALAEIDRLAYLRLAHSLVRVEAMLPDQRVNLGSGVVLSHNRVATNCHVTGNAMRVFVVRGSMTYSVFAQRPDWKHDICILKLDEVPGPYAPLGSSRQLDAAGVVTAIGFSGGNELLFSQGHVRALYALDGGNIIKSNTAFSSGASGGGLFDDNGQLVGLLTYRLRGTDREFFSMPAEWFTSALASDEGFLELGQGSPGTPLWQESRANQPLFMQAASLEVAHEWSELLSLANRWTSDQSDLADAWLARGKAEAALGQTTDGIADLEHAVKLQPRLAEAWMDLARLYRVADRSQDLAHARKVLLSLDSDLAADLDQ